MNRYALIILSILILPSVASAQWSAPTQAPSGGNASTPLNISSTAQSKAAGLLLNTSGASSGLIVQYGTVGFGTTSPLARLDVAGSNNGTAPLFQLSSVASWATTSRFIVTNAGSVGIGLISPAYKLDVNGTVGATAYYYTSDRRLKDEIVPLTGSLGKVLRLKGVSFSWKSNGKESVGVVAQDVEEIYPELVNTNASGMKSVEYANLIAPLIEAIKEQQVQIESLRKEIDILKK